MIKINANYLTDVARCIDVNNDTRETRVRNWRLEARDGEF
jgi:hypothetical protein